MFEWASAFCTSRCFGWSLPCTALIPFADSVNHDVKSQITFSLIHKGLHLQSANYYLYQNDFDNDSTQSSK